MARLNSRSRYVRALAAALVLLAAPRARAQTDAVFERLNLDKLQITSLGLAIGHIMPSQVVPTNLVAIQADYGNLSKTWRLVVGASYWASRLNDAVVQQFADSLRKSLSDPAAHVVPSPVRMYDVTFNGDLRYTPDYSGELKPFLGVGIAAHVINAEGALIKGTFVERSLDDIAAGLYVTSGIAVRLLPHFGIEGSVRGDLLSGFRSVQMRAGGTYFFGHIRDRRGPDGTSGKETGEP